MIRMTLIRFAPTLLLALLAAQAAAASEQRPEPSSPAASASADERADAVEERRVLALSDGRKLRALSRRRAGHWEVRERELWLVLPDELVASTQSERELLARLRDLSLRVPADDAPRRVALAQWMVEQGLWSEALQTLDAVLAAQPDELHARELLARAGFAIAFPQVCEDEQAPLRERLEALLRFGAQMRPALRELAARRLGELADPAQLGELLCRECASGVVTRRAFAVLALRRLLPGRAARELLQRAAFDPSDEVRLGASLGLRAVDNPQRIVPLVRLLGGNDAGTRIHAIEALGTLADAHALEPLLVHLARLAPQSAASGGAPRAHVLFGNQVGYLRDFDVQIAQGSSIADPIPGSIADATQLDVRVSGVGVESVSPAAERRAICRALSAISGEKPSEDPARWFAWWKTRGEAAAPSEPASR